MTFCDREMSLMMLVMMMIDGGDEGGETNDAPRVELSLGVHRDGGHRVVFSHSSLDH